MKLTVAQAGFIKGLLLAVASGAAAYLADPAHLTLFSGSVALIVAGLASSLESYIKAESGRAIFGAIAVR